MDEREESLQDRLVIGRKRDGRRQYDEAAKEELIQACLRPGASIARTAMTYGVNPNLVRTWIAAHQRKHSASTAVVDLQEGGADTIELSPSRDAFVPVSPSRHRWQADRPSWAWRLRCACVCPMESSSI